MAKNFDNDEGMEFNFDPVTAASKLPADISDGKKPINEYMYIPVGKIIPFQNKKESDFKSYSVEQFDMMVKSISEVGVLEAITVRSLPSGQYELLAGEHRWKAATAAGLETIPAHVMVNLTDAQAIDYFTITNLMRRENTIADKVNGWWLYYQSNLLDGAKGKLIDTDVLAEVVNNEGFSNDVISDRQIRRYAKMHDLIPSLIARLDSTDLPLSRQAGYHIAFINEHSQTIISDLKCKISMAQAELLHTDFHDGLLSEERIREVLKKVAPKKPAKVNAFTPLADNIKKITIAKLNPDYYGNASEIFEEALTLYLKEHPEYKKKR